MTTQGNILTADFPRAVRGYSQIAVDDFVRQLGERLESMQSKLTEQTARAGGLDSLLARANKSLAAFAEKESAISNGIITIEQRRTSVEQENEISRNNAIAECEELRHSAEVEALELVTNAQTQAADLLYGVQTEANEVRSRAQIDAHDLVRSANESADEILSSAQKLADDTVQSASREAEDALVDARTAAEEQAALLKALCSEYEETAGRIRRELEAQIALLPAPGSTLKTLSLQGVAVTSTGETTHRELAEAA